MGVLIVNGGGEINDEIDVDDFESSGDGGVEECGTSFVEVGVRGDMGYSVETLSMSEMLGIGIVARALGEPSMVWTLSKWLAWA